MLIRVNECDLRDKSRVGASGVPSEAWAVHFLHYSLAEWRGFPLVRSPVCLDSTASLWQTGTALLKRKRKILSECTGWTVEHAFWRRGVVLCRHRALKAVRAILSRITRFYTCEPELAFNAPVCVCVWCVCVCVFHLLCSLRHRYFSFKAIWIKNSFISKPKADVSIRRKFPRCVRRMWFGSWLPTCWISMS